MTMGKEVTLEKLDRELRSAGIEFTSLVQAEDGTFSLRDENDEQIFDDRVQGVIEAHKPDAPPKRLGARLRERWQAIKPAQGSAQGTITRALVDGFEAFLEEHAKEDEHEFLPMVHPELVEQGLPVLTPGMDIAARIFENQRAGGREEQAESAQLEQDDVDEEGALRVFALARQIAHEHGVTDAALVQAIVKMAVQEQALIGEQEEQ